MRSFIKGHKKGVLIHLQSFSIVCSRVNVVPQQKACCICPGIVSQMNVSLQVGRIFCYKESVSCDVYTRQTLHWSLNSVSRSKKMHSNIENQLKHVTRRK